VASPTPPQPEAKEAILISVNGPDQPGITAEISGVLADADAELLDVEQAVVQGFLSLNFLIVVPDREKDLLKDLLWKAREIGVHVDFKLVNVDERRTRQRTQSWAVTLVKPRLGAKVLARAAQGAAKAGFNIERMERLSSGGLSSMELSLSGDAHADPQGLRTELLRIQSELGCDVALQREGLLRRSKRLVVMDMDSTLIQQEVIDELARAVGVYEKVAAVTHRAMNGELPFDEALRERVMQLAGAPASILTDVLERIELTPGAEKLVRVMKRLGYRLAVISGGFIQVTEPIRQRLGLDYGFANTLEVIDGRITGRILGPIVNRQRKADLLESVAQTERIALEQVIAIGDGANDLDMLARAGLGIAFNAKRVVQEQARYALNQRNLDAVLYLLGLHDEEVRELSDTQLPSQT
jgi:phosphoserine phosphatase